MDGSNFDHLDEATSDTLSLQNLDLQAAHLHNNLLENAGGTMAASTSNVGNINPIDKLYLMQNSYFNNPEQWMGNESRKMWFFLFGAESRRIRHSTIIDLIYSVFNHSFDSKAF